MNCSKCNGYLERDYSTELETRSRPSYRCVNCSLRIDHRVLINRSMTSAQQAALVARPNGTPRQRVKQVVLCE